MIYLVRHCDYIDSGKWIPGRLPVQLSPKGTEQAEKLRDFFADKNITKIYTSPVYRAVQTAEIISRESISPIKDIRLVETSCAYQGMRYDHGVDWHDNYGHLEELGGENLIDQEKRMRAFWDEMIKDETENVVIVSHGHPLWTLYCSLTDHPLDQENMHESGNTSDPEYQKEGTIRPISLENGTVTCEPLVNLA